VDTEISLSCPSCGTSIHDGWEGLTENEVHDLTCADCGNRFRGAVLECPRCAADEVVTSQSDIEIVTLNCKACGSNIFDLDHDDEISSL